MLKTIKSILTRDKERYKVPRRVQDMIPISRIWPDGIFKVGNNFAKSFKFSDINYLVASREDKEKMFLTYSELLNSLDSGATAKITIYNHKMNESEFEHSCLMPLQGDGRDEYREEYNRMLLDKAMNADGVVQEKFVTITVSKKTIEEARAYFARVGADLQAHFAALGSKCVEMYATERLRVLHDFYRAGEEKFFYFDARSKMRRGHDFRDYVCPDSIEKYSDHMKIGDRYARVIYLKDYASYIKDNMISELTELNRNMMLSIDVIPVPTDEAVREVERRLLGVETNIANWQRRQNNNNNFSAVVPYDMEQQRKESKEFLDDLTMRDQRMMFAVITMVHTADTKEQLDNDTEAILATARKHMCQLATLKQIVAVALSQVGNVGGQPYWSWYGFGSRVEWCACFVSWCANECGYIENGIIPKFASCGNGIDWFKARAQWADNGVEPVPGMLIFFDWDNPDGPAGPQDDIADHVGIVERVENGRVYTVEGNSNDRCVSKSYPVGWYEIYGYGIPIY